MAENDSTMIILVVVVLVIICCSSCSSSLVVLANENPSFGGSALDFLRGDWYYTIFGYPTGSSGEYEGEVDTGGGGSGNNDDDNDKDGDKDKKYKNNCVYLYKDKDGKKYLISKCTDEVKTYKGSKLDGMSSLRVGKDLKVYLYDKNNKKKAYEGKKDKVFNLSGKWNNDTRKIILRHKNTQTSEWKKDQVQNVKDKIDAVIEYAESVKGQDSCKSKVCLYEHRDYKGKSVGFDGEARIYDFRNNSFMDGKISSIKIPDGYVMIAYSKPKYSGNKKYFKKSTHWIGNTWNDNIRSLIIKKTSSSSSGGGQGSSGGSGGGKSVIDRYDGGVRDQNSSGGGKSVIDRYR